MTIRVDSLKGLSEPLSVYVHIPFCRSKCPYCAFVSSRPGEGEIDRWIDFIHQELLFWRGSLGGKADVKTLYFGGGTPSVLSLAQWGRLFDILSKELNIQSHCEISVEANPDSLSVEHLELWKERSFSRISIGVQSFHDDELKWLGRRHDSARARWALDSALEAGFRVSGDLMFGLAHQGVRKWHYSLHEMVASGVTHISIYQLMVEEKSIWGKNPPEGVQNGYGHYRWAQWYLSRKGFSQYEIASFAGEDHYCIHNRAYWTRGNVLGLGPAAWGYIDGFRYSNIASLDDYGRSLSSGEGPVSYRERLSVIESASEEAILALRTKWGLDLNDYSVRYGSAMVDRFMEGIESVPPDCIVYKDGSVALSSKGMRVANAIWERLLWEDEDE